MGARADVLSTQSTREPDVVNGMRESMGSGRDYVLGRAVDVLNVDV